jgi:hypothetical protein
VRRVNVNTLGTWANEHLDPEFGEQRWRAPLHQHVLLKQDGLTVYVLVCSRDFGKTVFEATQVIFARVRISPREEVALGTTELLTKFSHVSEERWAERLKQALREIEVDPDVLNKPVRRFEKMILRRTSP